MIQHELLLGVVHGAVWTFKYRHFLTGKVLVEVCVEQNLLCEHGVAHGALVDQPTKNNTRKILLCRKESGGR